MSRTILVDRLLEFVNPFSPLNLHEVDVLAKLHSVPIRRRWRERIDYEDFDWDVGRIAFFVTRYDLGKKVDPIELESEVSNGSIYGPTIIDGHHRLAAAKIAGSKTIKADFSGRTDVWDYLTGKRKYPPEDL